MVPARVVFECLAMAVVTGYLMGCVRGLQDRQHLQHMHHMPLQVEQAETSVSHGSRARFATPATSATHQTTIPSKLLTGQTLEVEFFF